MAVYIGHDECQVIYVAKNGQQLRVSSIWVGYQQVFPPANREEVHVFTRDTQGYGRVDNGTHFAFSVPAPWWAASVDVVIIGAGEKGRDGTRSVTGNSHGAGGKSGAWVVKTIALPQSTEAVVRVGKGTSTSPHATEMILPGVGGQPAVTVYDGEGVRTPNSGSSGGYVTPLTRTEFDNYHSGGYGGSLNNPGAHPGGGGGGGQGAAFLATPKSGQPGGDGYVWLRFRSGAPIGGGGFTLYIGTTGGPADQPVTDWAVSIGKTRETITEITVPISIVGPVMWLAFSGCTALTTAPEMDTSQVTSFEAAFDGCQSLVNVPAYDTKKVTHMTGAFAGCSALKSLPPLDMRSVAYIGEMLLGCTSLESATFSGMGEAFSDLGVLDMRDTKLNAAAANALMQSLGTPLPGGTLQLPATATGADTSIATGKNWQVTVGGDSFILRVGVSSGDAFAPLREWASSIGKAYYTITEITVEMEVIGPSLQALFSGCYALASIPEMNASQVENIYNMFYNCSALESVTLPGMGNGFTTKRTLDMKDTKLNAAAANALMQSLGTVPRAANGSTLALPATAAGANTAIATAKNWTVTIG